MKTLAEYSRNETRIAMPLYGKMAARAFHTDSFRKALKANGFVPHYFLGKHYYTSLKDILQHNEAFYHELLTDYYDRLQGNHTLLQFLMTMRRFVVRTETTDLRLRETIENKLFSGSVPSIWLMAASMDIIRRIPGAANIILNIERQKYPTHVHQEKIKSLDIHCVLTPGMGNYNYWYEGYFAREAQRLQLPVFAAITNYDNIVNMGYRGFLPHCLAVWSQQMADEAVRLHKFPASRIEITGPVQYDRYHETPQVDRDTFIRSLGLDPSRKTILFAGGVNITRYIEFYQLFIEENKLGSSTNIVIRPYPHWKLLSSPEWQILEKLLRKSERVYISNPGTIDASGDRTDEFLQDFIYDSSADELSLLLRYCDVMVNLFSTISLEAAICDLPVIHIGYDNYTYIHTFNSSTAFQQRQSHNRRPLRLSAARIAKNNEETIKYIKLYLENRNLDKDARHDYALSECGVLDGKAGERLADLISTRL